MNNKKKLTFYEKVYKNLAKFIRKIFRAGVTGSENEPESGGCILCANHTSLLDVIILAAMMKRQVRYMAKKELFKIPVIGSLIKALGAFPVDRGGNDVSSIKYTLSLVESGELVGMFPQGTRHPGENPRDTEIKNGVGMMVYRSKANVLPVFIKTKGNKTQLFRKTEIIVGELIKYEDLEYSSGGQQEYKRASDYIFDKICTLGELPLGGSFCGKNQ